jgi:hypothetical protein
MADTRLILHVKGTDAETQELPKEDVKTAVAEGKLSYSQLIWSPVANTWKQVRDLPDLLPGESLILHVKGTESQTREMPKQAVKNAISRGEITHSQLIWSNSDSTWKPVREIPDLLPGETLILHVKGTESETRELPKPAIRAAIQRGEISQSQLIWSPLDSAWKPVAEMPELNPGESLVLHVKGTTADTKEMPKKAIRTAIKEGKITHSQLIWSASEHQWKQVRELPELLPSQKLAPAPQRRAQAPMLDNIEPDSPQSPVARAVAATPVAVPKARPAVVAPPKVTIAAAQPKIAQPTVAEATVPSVRVAQVATPKAEPQVVPVAKVQIPSVRVSQAATPVTEPRPVAAVAAQTPSVRVAKVAEARPAVIASPRTVQAPAEVEAVVPHAASTHHAGHKVEEHDNFHPVKWICIILGALVALVVGVNYFLITRPLSSAIGQTSYANVFVYGHYGAFVQPNVMVIHIPQSDKLTSDNLTDFLVALARSTPKNPITNDYFDRIAITSGWTAQYSFAGSAWKSLGDMKGQSAEDIRTQILSSGSDGGGNDLMPPTTMNETAQEERRQSEWKQIVANFVK